MFGISWAEFFVIFFVAVLVIPARRWPDVARFIARVIKTIRSVIWKITDASEQIKDQIDLERPIDDIIHKTTCDVFDNFSEPIKSMRPKKTPAKKQKRGQAK